MNITAAEMERARARVRERFPEVRGEQLECMAFGDIFSRKAKPGGSYGLQLAAAFARYRSTTTKSGAAKARGNTQNKESPMKFKSGAEAYSYVVEQATKHAHVRERLEKLANDPKVPARERAETRRALAEAKEARGVLEAMGIREEQPTGVIRRDDGTTEFRFRPKAAANDSKVPGRERTATRRALGEAKDASGILEAMGVREEQPSGVIVRDDGTTEFRFRRAGGAR